MDIKQFKKEALLNEDFRKEYERYDLGFEIGEMIINARMIKGITQAKLASLVRTKQPSIARIEGGRNLPSLGFLEKIAKAFGTYLLAPQFADLEENTGSVSYQWSHCVDISRNNFNMENRINTYSPNHSTTINLTSPTT